MALVQFILSLFRRHSAHYEVWDTSALSNHFELFKQKLKKDNGTIMVIPEGVSHEISVGRRNNENCKEIYKFIEGNVRNPRLIVAVTPNQIRYWMVDDQVVYFTEKYNKSGYTVKMVTCDRDQSFKARLKKLEVDFLSVSKSKIPAYEEINQHIAGLASKTQELPEIIPVAVEPKQSDLELPAKVIGKQCLLPLDSRVSVYDQRGKRKIAKSEGTVVNQDDLVYYKGARYIIKKITAKAVMCSAL